MENQILCGESYFVSDVHITEMESSRAQKFLRFLKLLNKKKAGSQIQLFFVGDIFDLWIHDYLYFQKKYSPIIDEIKKLLSAGGQLIYFEGNHDLYLRKFWQLTLGAQVISDFSYFTLNSLRVRVEHGDLMNPDDKGYLFLRSFLRNPFVKIILTHLYGGWVAKIGTFFSEKSRNYTTNKKTASDKNSQKVLETYALKAYQERPFDLFITGHTHVFSDTQKKDFRMINLGSWYDRPKYLCVKGNQVHIEFLEESEF